MGSLALDALYVNPVRLPDGSEHRMTQQQLDRFCSQVEEGGSGCWIWTGLLNRSGYGRFSLRRRILFSHRVAYMLLVGEIPVGLHIDHLCRVRECCNPAHLEPVTCRENVLRSPIAGAAVNARKTHCQRGHEFTPENTVAMPTGRGCLTCRRERGRRRYAEATGTPFTAEVPADSKRGQRRTEPDVCVHGHALDEANTYVDPKGGRRCRTCRRAEHKKASLKRRAR